MSKVIRPVSVTDQVANEIQRRISVGEISPGSRLPTERELCQEFNVSRVAVREAIARLRTDGYVVTRQGTGAKVPLRPGSANFRLPGADELQHSDFVHIIEIRFAVEVLAAQLAAHRCTRAHLELMHESLDEMSKAVEQRSDGSEYDDRFHQAIAAATQNPHLTQLADYLRHQFGATRRATWDEIAHRTGQARKAQRQHERLFAAIQQHDVRRARRIAVDHVVSTAMRLGLLTSTTPKPRVSVAQRLLR